MSTDPPAGSDNQTHPWRRFWARQIDYTLFAIATLGSLFFAIPDLIDLWPESTIASIATQAVLAALWILPEALLISTFRSTPGKWILGITVQNPGGEPLSFADALRRSVKVWAFGCAYAVYPLSLFAFRNAYKSLESQGTTRWDEHIHICHRSPRKTALACAAVGIISLNLIAVIPFPEELDTPQLEAETAQLVEAEVAENVKNLQELYRDHGIAIDSELPTRMIKLVDGEVHEASEALNRGGSVIIVGGCDQDCSDMDLIVFDPEGNEVDRDKETDDRPLVYLEPDLTGDYRIVMTMHSCKAEWCMGGYKLLRSDGLIPSPQAGQGTGFVVDPRGAILTANHVVEDAESLTVLFPDGTKREAIVERRSRANDVALLRVQASTPTYLPLAKPRSTRVGDPVFVMGFPLTDRLGDEIKFTEGSVTSLSGENGESAQFQMSAPIQHGSSGSPVINEQGHVVGIATSSPSDQELLEENGAVPQLVNWATKSEIAFALVGSQDATWTASSRNEAISRALSATVRVHVTNGE